MAGSDDRPRILVTGSSGQVGDALLTSLAPLGNIIAPLRGELDLANPSSIRACIQKVQPRWIVNAAAYTAVDQAESEPDLAFAINAEAPRILAEEAYACSAAILHFSTDYIFDGTKPSPYTENDGTNPLGVYGQSKLAGEQALLTSEAAVLIFRTSWVFGATGKNFLRTILKLGRERDELRIVGDQHGAPTWSRDLASMAAHVIAQIEKTTGGGPLEPTITPLRGIYHASGAGQTTWSGFAQQALTDLQRHDPAARLATIQPIRTDEYPTAAARPQNSRLNCEKLHRAFAWRFRHWEDSVADAITELSR